MDNLYERIAALPPEKRELLRRRMKQSGSILPSMSISRRLPDIVTIPLSFTQQRLWFLEQLTPHSSMHTLGRVLRLQGPLDVIALNRSLQEILQRHESLRTTFHVAGDGLPVQIISPTAQLDVRHVDLRAVPHTQTMEMAKSLIAEICDRPFDIEQGPLLRCTLLQLAEEDHIFLLTMHHIISDGWSLNVLLREIGILYDSNVTRMPATLPPLPIQYADVALWQRRHSTQERLRPHLAYWQTHLLGAPSLLTLPIDHPRPAIQSFRGARASLALSRDLAQRLTHLAQTQGVTLFMLLLTAFAVLLSRLSGQQDLVIGTPLANRERPEVQGLIGLLLNTLVVRLDLRGTLTFRELLQRVRQEALAAYAHQDLPFEQLVEALQPQRSLAYHPLFQVMFVHQNIPGVKLDLPGCIFSPLEMDRQAAKFDLTLSSWETDTGLTLMIEYKTDLFDRSSINNMLGYLKALLEVISVQPDTLIQSFMMGDEHGHQRQSTTLQSAHTLSASPPSPSPFVPPHTLAESILAGVWSRLFGIERISIHDNFFDLGGDSIRSIQMLASVRQQGLHITLQQLFQYQTIIALAQHVGEGGTSIPFSDPVSPFGLLSQEDRSRIHGDIEDAYPLTQLQGGMVFHSESSSEAPVYYHITSMHIQAPFVYTSWQKALQHVLMRHLILRTSFDLSSFNEPLQLVHRSVTLPLEWHDLRALPEQKQDEILASWLEKEKGRKFDWTHAPLLHCVLHQRSNETFQLSITKHHAILDGWSIASLLTELLKMYMSSITALQEEDDTLPSAPAVTFRDFVAMEQRATGIQENKQYWQQKLQGATRNLLPRRTTSRATSQPPRMTRHRVSLPSSSLASIKNVARLASVPLKSVLLAAHLRVMSLLTGQTDILTGLVSHVRPEEIGSEDVLGLFLNTVPFRLQLSGGSWLDMIRATFEAERDLLPARFYPLAQIQRDLGGQTLFEVVFNFFHFPAYQEIEAIAGLSILQELSFSASHFTLDILFQLKDASSTLQLIIDYDATVLSEEQIVDVSAYYKNALHSIAQNPYAAYETCCLLSSYEMQRLIEDWNATQKPYPKVACLHHLFEEQVRKTPQHIAVLFEHEQLTYGEVNLRANQIAHYLRLHDVRTETLVGLFLERSLEMLIVLLGVLKAGGTYMPLDPAYPQERLQVILEDSRADLVITHSSQECYLPERHPPYICLDCDAEDIARCRTDNPDREVSGEHMAYVIYTSGSTGRPKGVQVVHSAVVNFLYSMQELIGITERDSLLAVTTLSFDIAVLELFLPLLAGARVILEKREIASDGVRLLEHLTTCGATIMQATPSSWSMLLAAGLTAPVVRGLCILCGGEALSSELARQLLALQPMALWNLYGPTETTIWSTACLITEGVRTPSIGRPIANTQVYVLDSALQPLPVGVLGSLYIGGDGLARGYLHHPELTAAAFLPDPFSRTPGARLYCTGDQARFLPDGMLELLGRKDHQVKIHGFRIELGEIEAALGRYPALQAAAVVVGEDVEGDKYLIAYIVPYQKLHPSPQEIRAFLQQTLPVYMVPAFFVPLETLPMTPNGKVDRRSLPPFSPGDVLHTSTYVPPRSSYEHTIADIWQKVLGIDRIGIYDNFFELGGYSMQATQLLARLRVTFHVELSLLTLFNEPTIAAQAATITQLRLASVDTTELLQLLTEFRPPIEEN